MNRIPVLKIRDENGNFIPINAIRGDNGKSAYEQAKDGGYRGTEEEFIALLNGLTNSEDATHYSDFNNPHKVTSEQVGALPTLYPTSADLNTELTMGGNRTAIHCYYEVTLNTPYKEGKTDCTHGMVITNAHSSEYATQLCLPSGSNRAYIRALNGQGVQPWKQVAVFDDVAESETYLQQYIDGQIDRLEQTGESLSKKVGQEILPALESLQAELEQVDVGQMQRKPELVWENANKQSAFGSQTISLKLSDYKFVMIECGMDVSTAVSPVQNIYWARVGVRTTLHIESTDGKRHTRASEVEATGITFWDGYLNSNVHNSSQVPLRIYGVK